MSGISLRLRRRDVRGVGGMGGMLEEYEKEWRCYWEALCKIKMIFVYLDRFWVAESVRMMKEIGDDEEGEVWKVGVMGMMIWRRGVLEVVGGSLVECCLGLVEGERRGRLGGRGIGKGLEGVRLFLESVLVVGREVFSGGVGGGCIGRGKEDLGGLGGCEDLDGLLCERNEGDLRLYRGLFERRFLEVTLRFYEVQSRRMLLNLRAREYIRIVEEGIMKRELEVANCYLDRTTFPVLIKILHAAFIAKHANVLYEEADSLLKSAYDHCTESQSQDFQDLAQIYKLLSHVDTGTKSLQTLVRKHVVMRGRQAVGQYEKIPSRPDLEAAARFVEASHKVYAHFEQIIATAFKGDSSFHLALDQGCSRYLRVPSFACLTAAYCHVVLSSSDHIQASDQEPATGIEARLAKALRIFRYLDLKDEFNQFYAQYLTKRLLSSGSCKWRSAEESMIWRLQNICGLEYVSGLKRMFADINHSHRETALYSSTHLLSLPETSVFILTSTAWPIRPVTTNTDEKDALMISKRLWERLPRAVEVTERFREYYTGRHSGRTLTYTPHLSRVILRARKFPCASSLNEKEGVSFDIDCGPLMASLLLLFADPDTERLSMNEIVASLRVPAPLLCRGLRSLLHCGLLRVVSHGARPVDLSHVSISERTMFSVGAISRGIEKIALDDHIEDYEHERMEKRSPGDRKQEGSIEMQAAIISVVKREKRCTVLEIIRKLLEKGRDGEVESVGISLAILEDKEYVKREVITSKSSANNEPVEVWEYLP